VQAQAAQLVAHASRGDVLGPASEQDAKRLTQVLVGEPVRDEHEHQHRIEQRLRVGVAKAQRGRTLAVDLTRSLRMLEGIVPQRTVVADLLDLQQPPVGGKSDAAQRGQVLQQPPNAEVARVVDGGLAPRARVQRCII